MIHACNPPETSWIIGRFWRLFGKRFIFDHHDLSPELYEVKFPGRRDLMYRFLRFMERADLPHLDRGHRHQREPQGSGC